MKRLSNPKATIDFEHLWLLFKPGTAVYWRNRFEAFPDAVQSGIVMYYRYVDSKASKDTDENFKITVWSLQTDGRFVGRLVIFESLFTFLDHPKILCSV